MSVNGLQMALQRIQEIRARFEPSEVAESVEAPAGGQFAFDAVFSNALNDQQGADGASELSGLSTSLSALIQDQGTTQGVDPNLLKAVIRNESNFNPRAVSSAGAQGLMQLMPGTARDLGVQNSFDPVQNVAGGAKYLKGLLQKYHQSVPMALAAYNAGPGAVDRHGGIPPYAETSQYVKKVMQSYQRYQQADAPMEMRLTPQVADGGR